MSSNMAGEGRSDRSLWLRTLLGALALGAAGYLLAKVVANVLRLVATPDYDKYIRPAVFDARWQQIRAELDQGTRLLSLRHPATSPAGVGSEEGAVRGKLGPFALSRAARSIDAGEIRVARR